MIEKVKNFFAGLTSFAVFFYVAGFLAQHAHDRMLGMLTVEPLSLDYLITGGEFVMATLFALFSTLFSRFYYFVTFFIAVLLVLRSCTGNGNAPKKLPLSKTFFTSSIVIILVFCFVLIPIFTSTFVFSDLLLTGREISPAPLHKYSPDITKEIWTWILNAHDNLLNLQHLSDFYVLSLLAAAFSIVLLLAMMRVRKSLKENQAVQTDTVTDTNKSEPVSRFKKLAAFCKCSRKPLIQGIFDLAIIVLVILVSVQVIVIPMNYGILLKSNQCPEIRLEMAAGEWGTEAGEPVLDVLPNREPGSQYKIWLMRENEDEILLHVVYFEKGGGEFPVFRLMNLKKSLVRKVEILGHTSIFKYK